MKNQPKIQDDGNCLHCEEPIELVDETWVTSWKARNPGNSKCKSGPHEKDKAYIPDLPNHRTYINNFPGNS
jgi:hypothetical protein